MSIEVPWVSKGIEKVKQSIRGADPRKNNTEEENELLYFAEERFRSAETAKTDHRGEPLNTKWRRLEKMYKTDHWQEPVPDHKSAPVLPYTFALIEAALPRLTDNRPEVLVYARTEQENQRLADHLTKVQDYLWYSNRMQQKINEACRTALKIGTSIFKCTWDVDAHDGKGEVKYSVIHPMNFFPDPRAYKVEDMEFCFVRVPKSLEYFRHRWEDKGHLVVADDDWVSTEQIEGSEQTSQEQTASLTEYWFRDEDGNLCCMYYAGDVVLEVMGGKYDDSGEPLYRMNKFPFSRLVDYPADKEFWGVGEIEIIELLQQLVNSYEAQIIDNTRLMANAQWVVSKVLSGLTEEDSWMFDDRPGNIIWTREDGVRKEPGVPIPHHITQHQQELVAAMEQILGIHDVVQGQRPVGVRSASGIIALQESANVRMREKSKQLEFALTDLADIANWLVLEFYEEPRRVRMGGESPPVTLDVRKVLEERVVDMAREAGEIPPMRDFEMMEREEVDDLMLKMRYPEFDVEVKVGASVPYSQAMLYEQAKEFYQLGVIDRKALLEATGFPNKEEILERIEGREAAEGEGGRERVGERTMGGQGRPPGGGGPQQ